MPWSLVFLSIRVGIEVRTHSERATFDFHHRHIKLLDSWRYGDWRFVIPVAIVNEYDAERAT